MDYAQYVNRRPPSPPPSYNLHRSLAVSPSLSSTSTLSVDHHHRSSRFHPPVPGRTTASVSAQLHRRAVRDEYSSLAALVAASADAETHHDRQETVRIRLEDMLTQTDQRAVRVLNLALEKCNAKLDSLAASTRSTDDARARMRVIESKYFHGARAPVNVPPELRAMHIRREGVATLVEHIQCTLHDQVRIHFLLQELAEKLKFLRTLLYSINRGEREPADGSSDRADAQTPPATPPPRNAMGMGGRRQGLTRRTSRGPFRNISDDRFGPGERPSSVRSQRSLPRREGRLIPFVVKRALSYNASPYESSPKDVPGGHATAGETSWWGDTDVVPVRSGSEPRLNTSAALKQGARNSGNPLEKAVVVRGTPFEKPTDQQMDREDSHESEEGFGASPVSICTNESEYSPQSKQRSLKKKSSAIDQSVLLDIDSLCTEASSVLSSSRGVGSDKYSRRGSRSSSLFYATEPRRRPKGLGRLRIGRIRVPSQIKKLWLEVNEMYSVILTHGPHLVEEKIVSAASMEAGVLGPWTASKKGRGSRRHISFQSGVVIEAIRRVESVVQWQQRLIVAIRRDHNEQRKSLRHADSRISQAYLQSIDTYQGKDER